MQIYILLFLFFFIGLGTNVSSLSPYILSQFGEKGEWVFLAMQLSMPLGNFLSGWISDKTKKIRIFVLVGLAISAPLQYCLYSFPNNWVLTIVSAASIRFIMSCNFQWMSIAAIESYGESRFSKLRSAGTFGFLLVQLSLFFMTFPGAMKVPVLTNAADTGKIGVFAYPLCFLLAYFLPKERHSHQEFRFKDAFHVVVQKNMLLFFTLSFLFYFGYQITDNYMGKYISASYGLEYVFLSWSFATILEIPFLIGVPYIVNRFGTFSILYISILAGMVRFLFFSYSTLGVSIEWLLFIQIWHSVFFAGYYMGSIYWIRKNTPHQVYGSVYGLFSIFSQSLGGIFGNLSCGYLLHSKIGSQILIKYSPQSKLEVLDFFPMFLMAGLIYLLLLPFFKLLKDKHELPS